MPAEFSTDGQKVRLSLANCSATDLQVYLHGATVTSWTVEGKEQLFVSKSAVLNGQKAIRGGIPLVFPQFGLGPQSPKVQHGFARISRWQWSGVEKDTPTELIACFLLEHSDQTIAAWPHKFRLKYSLALSSNTLSTRFDLVNTGESRFSFTALFHTYFRVSVPISSVRIRGLCGLQFKDKARGGGAEFKESNDFVTITSEVDRVYCGWNGRPLEIIQGSLGASATIISAENLCDVVVWNPWVEKSKSMTDFGDEEYKEMVCVEAGTVDSEINLEPGQSWTGSQLIKKCL